MVQEVPARKIGDEWRFSKTALQNWLGAAEADLLRLL